MQTVYVYCCETSLCFCQATSHYVPGDELFYSFILYVLNFFTKAALIYQYFDFAKFSQASLACIKYTEESALSVLSLQQKNLLF